MACAVGGDRGYEVLCSGSCHRACEQGQRQFEPLAVVGGEGRADEVKNASDLELTDIVIPLLVGTQRLHEED